MKITAIKAQVKSPERVSIYIDDAYSFSLNPNQLLEHKLYVGLEITEEELMALKKASDFGKLQDRILRYVLLRPHSRREVENYCRRKQLDMDACNQIIDHLESRAYISDAAFARAWVESRQLNKAMSKRALQLELKRKGVSDVLIAEALANQGYDEAAALNTLIAKKRRQAKYQDRQKLAHYLMRQGFSYDAVEHALSGL